MHFTKFVSAMALSSAVAYASPSPANNGGNTGNNGATGATGNGATGTTLLANAIQSGSFNDGSDEIGSAEVGQALSATSQNNFINNCAGKTLTNGLQITTGSCNGITMGDIPAKTAMVSSIILNPKTGDQIPSDTSFNITVQMANLVAGAFTNADATYYAAPQALQGGKVVGHTHVTVQDLGNSLNPTQALDATQFAFFKGINDAGNGQGLLSAAVTGGLPAGNYRVCTLASSSNHQPVLMPVAQRGSADDCTKFVVTGNGNTANAASNNGSGGQAAAALAASAVAAGPDVAEATAAAATSAAASTGKGGQNAAGSTGKSGSAGNAGNAASGSSAANSTSTSESGGNAAAEKGGNASGQRGSKGGAAAQNGGSAASAAGQNAAATATASAQNGGSAANGQGFGRGRGGRARREFIA